MTNQNDSFIDEVTDELRRDRLYHLFRRYAWIPVLLIILIVGGAIWGEYSLSRDRAAAEAWGDAVLAAQAGDDPAAIAAVDPHGSGDRKALTDLLAAAAWTDAGEADAAAAALNGVSDGAAKNRVLQDLALLKLVMLESGALDAVQRDQILSQLSVAGAPFELLALEQKALALIDAGRNDDALMLIKQIRQMAGLSEALQRRLTEMMIALGEPVEQAQALPDETLPAN